MDPLYEASHIRFFVKWQDGKFWMLTKKYTKRLIIKSPSKFWKDKCSQIREILLQIIQECFF